jgi:cobalt-zinc-cadmium resistance protein CzcA
MALTVMIAFVVSLTFVPAAIAITLRKPVREDESLIVRRLKLAYAPSLRMSIARPVMAGAAVRLRGASLRPPGTALDEKNIVMEVRRVPNTALAQSQAMQLLIESQINKFPEVAFVFSRIGPPIWRLIQCRRTPPTPTSSSSRRTNGRTRRKPRGRAFSKGLESCGGVA